jgi:hypothetical protein
MTAGTDSFDCFNVLVDLVVKEHCRLLLRLVVGFVSVEVYMVIVDSLVRS